MSINFNKISNESGNNGPLISGISTVNTTGHIRVPNGTEAQRVGTESGSLRFNTDINYLEFYNGTEWIQIFENVNIDPINSRGVFAGGESPTSTNTIDYVSIPTTGNALDFGDLTEVKYWMGACGSSTRGLFGAGRGPTSPFTTSNIDYITFASEGNAIDFGGDLTAGRYVPGCSSNSTRGVWFGGAITAPSLSTTIDYVTIATTGVNATDYGDLTNQRYTMGSCSSSTRGVVAGGRQPAYTDTIEYIEFSTGGLATDFGDLSIIKDFLAGCSSPTRGIFGGGFTPTPATTYVRTIEYITIASTSNSLNFGTLSIGINRNSSCSNSIRGLFAGGATPTYSPVTLYDTIEYVTIATTGNATDFGDLTEARDGLTACSNAHGGL